MIYLFILAFGCGVGWGVIRRLKRDRRARAAEKAKAAAANP